MHSTAAILSIGDELTRGQNLDTNSRWLSSQLLNVGIETVEHVTIPDHVDHHSQALSRLALHADLIISTGGLGPTADDLTRDALALAIARASGDTGPEPLVVDAHAMRDLEAKFAARGRPLSDLQRLQAYRPRSARCIPNALGTAPGLVAQVGRAEVFCLPGPPREMVPMFEHHVLPALRPPSHTAIQTRLLHMIGIGEGDAAKLAGSLLARDRNPLLGITATGSVVSWRLCARASTQAQATALLDADEAALRTLFNAHIFGTGQESLPATIIQRLAARSLTLGVVESCTAGLLGAMLTDASGASAAFRGGLVTYSNSLKQSLANVSEDALAQHGAVSPEVALHMASGGLVTLNADIALAITGVAGPTGGSPEKPVGTIWVALAAKPGAFSPQPVLHARRFLIPGDRADVRERAARAALAMLHFALANGPNDQTPLLFELR